MKQSESRLNDSDRQEKHMENKLEPTLLGHSARNLPV